MTIPRMSNRKAREQRAFAPVRKDIIESAGGQCSMRIPNVCTGEAQGVHHVKKQSQGGPDDKENCLSACNACNLFAEEFPAAARRMGFVKRSWE